MGRRCHGTHRTPSPAQGRAEEDTMSRLGKLFRATSAAALAAVGATPAPAQQPAPPKPPPDIYGFLAQDQVAPAGFGRTAAPSPSCACPPAPCCPGTAVPGYPSPYNLYNPYQGFPSTTP